MPERRGYASVEDLKARHPCCVCMWFVAEDWAPDYLAVAMGTPSPYFDPKPLAFCERSPERVDITPKLCRCRHSQRDTSGDVEEVSRAMQDHFDNGGY